MVTWLHFWQIHCDAMDSAVTNMVTNGYIGYKQKSCYNEDAKQGRFVVCTTLSLYIYGIYF